jgi:signal transduction histidine kinase
MLEKRDPPKHLVIWADQDPAPLSLRHFWNSEDSEVIEVQSPVLAEQFLRAHQVSLLLASSKFGLDFWSSIKGISSAPVSILLLEDTDLPSLPQFINRVPQLAVLQKPLDPAIAESTILRSLEEAASLTERRRLKKESAKKYRELEALNEGLEKMVEERTRHIEGAKLEEEEKLNKVRNLIRFIKDLSAANAQEEFLDILRREVRKFGKLGDPILLLVSPADGVVLYSYQAGQFLRTESKAGTQIFTQIKLSESLAQKFLANHYGRPFGRTFVLPLEMQSNSSSRLKVYLCLENFLTEAGSQKVIDFLLERAEPMSITVDRLLLEQEHSENAFRWERTFDSLERPIAIIDVDYEVLRSNRKFSERHAGKSCFQSFAGRELACEGCPLGEALEKGRPAHGTVLVPTASGTKTYQVHSYPINLEGGRPTNVVNAYVDITQSREIYIRLLQSEKMGALGVLAGNIAHELNNPLTGIRSLAQVLLTEIDPTSTLSADLKEIEKATERSQKIIRNLQDFSSKEGAKQEKFSLDEIVERTIPMLKTLLRTHRLEMDLGTSSQKVLGEPHLIQQVIFNLINNACQAMKGPGTLTVETEVMKKEGLVLLRVKDTGTGISEEIATRIFDPFFTTKREGQGTGLGLSLSREIVERHKGKIEFKSTPGKGTEFLVMLPQANL